MYSVVKADQPGGIMENTLEGAAGASLNGEPAVQNAASTASTLKLVLLWVAVGVPMIWGIMKALEDLPALISSF
jgi:hypothetical protein